MNTVVAMHTSSFANKGLSRNSLLILLSLSLSLSLLSLSLPPSPPCLPQEPSAAQHNASVHVHGIQSPAK